MGWARVGHANWMSMIGHVMDTHHTSVTIMSLPWACGWARPLQGHTSPSQPSVAVQVADPLNITAPPHAASDASNTQYITVSDLTNK